MKRRGQTTPYAVRVKIGELASEGKTDAEIAIELDDNYWTVRKWRRRFQQQGKAGLVSTMGRPVKGAPHCDNNR
jgi:transposase-like protein